MNFDKLTKSVNARIRLRPSATRKNEKGQIEAIDDIWLLESVSRKDGIKLSNTRTYHVLALLEDHVHHYTSDPLHSDGLQHGFLELIAKVHLTADGLSVEPILSGSANPRNTK